jgi:heptosyltransferase II
MNILVRLPNWLGDLIMSTAFIKALHQAYPYATIDIIVKKSLSEIADLIPSINHTYLFDKNEFSGLTGAYKFGSFIQSQKQYDLFFSLPGSFSSAVMGYASGASKRVGYRSELRNWLLTNRYQKPKNIHRVEEYIQLLQLYTGSKTNDIKVELKHSVTKVANRVIVNCNSEASSRRLPVEKAVAVILQLQKKMPNAEWILIGSTKEKKHVDAIATHLPIDSIINKAGSMNLKELTTLIASASLMISTDSGPAHLSGALGVPTIVLFGAGNEKNTAPYHPSLVSVVRNGTLPCEPCVKNTCKFGEPKCLLQLDIAKIETAIQQIMI